jgi:hypothetical protein
MSELGTFAVKQGTVPYKPLPAKPIPPLLLQAYRALVKQHNSQAHYWSCNRGDKVCVCPLRELAETIAAIEAEYPEAK